MSAQVAAKPITPRGFQLSMTSSTPVPDCWESRASSLCSVRAKFTAMRVAACGAGRALSIRSDPCGRGSEARWRIAAYRLACECTTAFGIPVVPEEWVIATGSPAACRYGSGAASGSPEPSSEASASTGATGSYPASSARCSGSVRMPTAPSRAM